METKFTCQYEKDTNLYRLPMREDLSAKIQTLYLLYQDYTCLERSDYIHSTLVPSISICAMAKSAVSDTIHL